MFLQLYTIPFGRVPCGGYGGLERFWLGLCLSAPRREVTPGTWLAKPFARWQARSLPCQRSGPGRTARGSETDAEDTQNDNKTAAQVSNSARRNPKGLATTTKPTDRVLDTKNFFVSSGNPQLSIEGSLANERTSFVATHNGESSQTYQNENIQQQRT